MKKFLHLFLLFSFCIYNAIGQIPPGYYDSADGLTGTALQSALHNIIKGHTVVAYGSLYTYFATTDAKPGDVVWDMYSDIPNGTPPYLYHYNSGEECGNYNSEGDCYNREHSWPNSWFGGEVYPMYSDLFHLYPTDGYVNNRRANYPYGEVGSAQWTSENGSKVGNCTWPGYSGTVFEPIDTYKGDFARSYFYMSTRYYGEDAGWPGSAMTAGSQLKPWALQMLLSWNGEDPVSQKEIDRNNAVYGIQNNRNPFIDHPEYAQQIWGSGSGIPSFSRTLVMVYPNPANQNCFLSIPDEWKNESVIYRMEGADGRLMIEGISSGSDKISVDLREVPEGIYVITVVGLMHPEPLHLKLIRN
ncbi:MAG: endonuclease [Bacteroidota bacterium]|nr:endonuclease [Bacteroidota bacterium]